MTPEARGMHGGPDAQGVPRHDFSTNTNACGPCPTVLAALQAADCTHYPDPGYGALREALAAFHRVARERIVLAASASEFILRITAALPQAGRGLIEVPRHAYGDYAQAAQVHGFSVSGAALPGAAVSGTAAPLRVAWLCEPSSPLGEAEPNLAARVEAAPAHLPLVLDRAYEPLRLSGACALSPRQLARVWQLWSPNKALALTGVRAAYAIAPENAVGESDDANEAQCALRQRLEALTPSWPLGSHGVAMLQAWTDGATQRWLAECLPTLRAWKARQQRVCEALGWPVRTSQANYFCADWSRGFDPHTAGQAQRALPFLRTAGIKLRDTASFGLPGQVRLGVRPPDSQDALQEAMTAFLRTTR